MTIDTDAVCIDISPPPGHFGPGSFCSVLYLIMQGIKQVLNVRISILGFRQER